MLLGIWKSVEDLEMNINLDELRVILDAAREKEMRHNRFMAAIQGIDIDKDSSEEGSVEDRFEKIQARANAKLAGKSEEEFDLDDLGLGFEIEE